MYMDVLHCSTRDHVQQTKKHGGCNFAVILDIFGYFDSHLHSQEKQSGSPLGQGCDSIYGSPENDKRRCKN